MVPTPAPTKSMDRPTKLAVCGITLLSLALRLFLLPFKSSDFHTFIDPWLESIRSYGGIWALKEVFYDYNPPYIYLLCLLSYLPRSIPDVAIAKLPSIFFDFVAAYSVFKVIQLTTSSQVKAVLGFAVVLFSPTLILNSSLWGQCDVIYSTFLMFSLLLLLGRRPWLASICFGCALSFKLQAMFFAPFIIWAWISGLLTFWNLLAIPGIFALSLMPALAIGRSLESLLSIYLNQSKSYHSLSMNAPNLYYWIPDQQYNLFVPAGFMLALAFVLISSWLVYEKKIAIHGHSALLLAITSVLAMPFLLPKMHERYFFAAELFAIPLMLMRPRWSLLYALLQLVSVSTYLRFLFGKPILENGIDSLLLCGTVFVTLIQFAREPRSQEKFADSWLELPSVRVWAYLICCSILFAATFLFLSSKIVSSSLTSGDPIIVVANEFENTPQAEFVPAFDIRQDWGQARQGRNIDEDGLRLVGGTFANGFGVHANSSQKFRLASRFHFFEGKVGIPRYLSPTGPTSIRFTVKNGESILWSSPIMTASSPVLEFKVPVDSVEILELVTNDAGNGNNADHGSWVDLRVVP